MSLLSRDKKPSARCLYLGDEASRLWQVCVCVTEKANVLIAGFKPRKQQEESPWSKKSGSGLNWRGLGWTLAQLGVTYFVSLPSAVFSTGSVCYCKGLLVLCYLQSVARQGWKSSLNYNFF